MGCGNSKKIINTFKNYNTKFDLYNDINTSNVFNDCDIIFSIDASLSNIRADNSSNHDIPPKKQTKYRMYNQYLYVLELINSYIGDKLKSCDYKLQFYGTKIGTSTASYIKSTELKPVDTKPTNMNDIINMYIGTIEHYTKESLFHTDSSFIQSIDSAIEQVKNTKRFTLLIILTDGKYDNSLNTKIIKKIYEASNYPLSILIIGIGDNDFNFLKHLDNDTMDNIMKKHKKLLEAKKQRKFDNFRIVVLNDIIHRPLVSDELRDQLFVNIFSELPQQYIYIQRQNVLDYKSKHALTIDIYDNRSPTPTKLERPRESIVYIDIHRDSIFTPKSS